MTKRIIDLSHPIYHEMPVWPGSPAVGVITQSTEEISGFNETLLVFDIHSGTHMDAPFHVLNDGKRVDEILLDVCIGDAVVVDLTHKRAGDKITVKDLEDYDKDIREVKRVILNTGWYKYFGKTGKPRYYTDFPQFTPDVAEWLVERGVKLLAMDLPSPSLVQDKAIHETLFKGSVLVIIENVTNLDKLTKRKVFFIAIPLNIKGREGSPVRAVAIEGICDLAKQR